MERFTYALEPGTSLPKGIGYKLYGALNDLAGPVLAAHWHSLQQAEIHQHLFVDEGRFYWRLALLADDEPDFALRSAREDLARRLAGLTRLPVDGRDLALQVVERVTLSRTAILHHHLSHQAPADRLTLTLRAPLAFKRAGHYDPLPQPELMAQSLINRWAPLLPELAADPARLRAHAATSLLPARMSLRTTAVPIKGSHIPGSLGDMTLILKARPPLRRLWGLFFALGEWSGIGVKTALGMGGISVMAPGWTSLPANAMIDSSSTAPQETTDI